MRAKRPTPRSIVDALVQDSPDHKDPLKGFLLAAPYANDHNAITTTTTTADASPPPAQPWPVPLVKSRSAPAACFEDRVSRGDFGGGLEEPDGFAFGGAPPQQAAWRCRGCPNADLALLSTGADSSVACDLCGTVDADVTLVAGCRQKNCPKDEDKTVVADEVGRPAHELAAEALAAGDETSRERRKRHLQSNPSSRVARSVARKHDLSAAQAKVDAEIVRASRARVDGDPRVAKKRDAVLRFVTSVHEYLGPGLDDRIKRYIRMEAARVVCSGFEHAKHCTEAGCQISIPSRANALIGLCTVQKCLERLVCDAPAFQPAARVAHRVTLSDVAPEVSRHELLKCIDETHQTQAQGAGASQRAQVAAAVGLVLDWIPEQVDIPCASATETGGGSPATGPVPDRSESFSSSSSFAGGAASTRASSSSSSAEQAAGLPPPPPLALPPPLLVHSDSLASLGSAADPRSPATGDPNDAVWAVRNSIFGAWKLANVRSDVRQAATAAVQEEQLADWIRYENTLPMCVLGVAMLKAAAIKLKLEDGTDELLRTYCHQFQISPTTAEEAALHLSKMMRVQPTTTLGLFGDGIF